MEIPEGTILEVLVTPKIGSNMIEVIPVKVNDITDTEGLLNFFVPERFRSKPDFVMYSISLKSEYLGKQLKKVD